MITAFIASILVGTNAVTFTVTATGVEKGTPLEFMFAGKGSDRDYETMFLLEDPVDEFAKAVRSAGIPDGSPIDLRNCRLWPAGCEVTFKPSVSEFVQSEPLEEGIQFPAFCYTGGARQTNGQCVAASEMPLAVLAFYDCPQSLVQYDGIFPQGLVYSHHKCAVTLKKGEKRTFTLSWDGKTNVRHLDVRLGPGKAVEVLQDLRSAAEKGELDVTVSFSPDVTIEEATLFSSALSTVDSSRIKFNGRRPGDFFYRAFQPLVKWRDRKERLTQPFEITVSADKPDSPRIVFIEEDWSGEGLDPKLTPKTISFDDMRRHPQTDTCLFFAPKSLPLGRLQEMLRRLPETVVNTYVYGD